MLVDVRRACVPPLRHLYSADLPSSTSLTSLSQPKLLSTPSEFFLPETGMRGCPAVIQSIDDRIGQALVSSGISDWLSSLTIVEDTGAATREIRGRIRWSWFEGVSTHELRLLCRFEGLLHDIPHSDCSA